MSSLRHSIAVQIVPISGANPLSVKVATTGLVIGSAGLIAFQASGGVGPYSFSLTTGALPTGMGTIGALTGVSTGTPTVGGTFTGTVQVTDSTPGTPLTTTYRFTMTVVNPLSFVQILPVAVITNSYSQQIVVAGATGTVTFTVPTPGHGFTMTTSGLLSAGSVSAAGLASFTTTATDSGTGASLTFTINVSIQALPLAMNPNSAWSGVKFVNTTYTRSYSVSNGAGPYTVTSSSTNLGELSVTITKNSTVYGAGCLFTATFTPLAANWPNPYATNDTHSFTITDGYGDSVVYNITTGVANNLVPNIGQLDGTTLQSALQTINVVSTNGLKATAPGSNSLRVDINVASSTLTGSLSSSDWTTFNSKWSGSFSSFGSTPNTAGASFTGGVLTLQPADASNPGGITAATFTAFSTGRLLNATFRNSGTTFTTGANTKKLYFRMWGGGGGGGGASSAASSAAAGGGGGSGGYLEDYVTVSPSTAYTFAIGAGGTAGGVGGTAGGNGGNTTLIIGATTYTAGGGGGGAGQTAGTTIAIAAGGTTPTQSTNSSFYNGGGMAGAHGIRLSGLIAASGAGGSNTAGGVGSGLVVNSNGNGPQGPSGGGSGGVVLNGTGAATGGVGGNGYIVFYEYSQ